MKHGVTKAAIRYKTSRQNIYRWKKKYDGDIHSLADRSHRPRSHPKQHTETEITLVKNMRRRNPHDGLVVFWVKLRRRGYTRSISGLYKLLRRIGGAPIKLPNPKYIPKPYEQMRYPGQKVQIDVKYVPSVCLVGEAVEDAKECGGYYYQYTFIDEYSRFRYLEAFKEKDTYTSTVFLKHVVEKFPYAIECVQTDNGFEFTNEMGNSKKKHPLNIYMFPSPRTGGMYHPDSIVKLHEKILNDAGIEHLRFHDLRHSFATYALQSGADVKTLSCMLGHYSAGFTLNTYCHATRDMQADAARKIGGFMSAQTGIG